MPHHLSYKQGRRGVKWEIFEEDISPVVELYSMHGCSENDQAEYPFLHSMGPRNYENTMQKIKKHYPFRQGRVGTYVE